MNIIPQHEVTRGVNTYHQGKVTQVPCKNEKADTTQPKLIEALGGQSAFEALPVLDLSVCAASGGGTGYIDFVRLDDMTAPIMRGEDDHGRPFLAFRLSKTEVDYGSPNYPNDTVEKTFVETLFRRYTTGPVWTSGGASTLCQQTVNDDVLCSVEALIRAGRFTGTSPGYGNDDPLTCVLS